MHHDSTTFRAVLFQQYEARQPVKILEKYKNFQLFSVHKMQKTAHREMTISYTPHTPRLRKFLIVAVWLFSWIVTNSYSQGIPNDSIPSLAELESSLKEYHNKLWNAEREEYRNINRKKWWYYLPSVGLQFGLPSVQFHTGTLAVIDRDKAQQKARLTSIDLSRELQFNQQLQELRNKYRLIQLHIEKQFMLELIKKKEHELFEIYMEAMVKKEITPEDFKIKEIKYLREQQAYEAFLNSIGQEIYEVLIFAHFNEERRPVWYDIKECEIFDREN